VLHIKDIKRLEQISSVFFEEGFGYYVQQAKLHVHLPFHKRVLPTKLNKQRQAIHLRVAFEKLGPTFVKLGQLLSLRPDLVPREYCEELEKLQDTVRPISYLTVKKVIEEDLQQPLTKLFKTFDKKPLASASIAQVHGATLHSGKQVVVKVQRPNIRSTIDADLDILFHIAHSLDRHFPNIHNYNPIAVVKEFALWTRRELNFILEADSAQRLRKILGTNKNVVVPKVLRKHSSKRVLTMHRVFGTKISNIKELHRQKISCNKLARTYFNSILEQALLHGFFHADPHPANIFVQKDGTIAYLDYGIMGTLTNHERRKVIRFISSIRKGDPNKSLDIIISLASHTQNSDVPGFKAEALPVLQDVYSNSIHQKSIGKAIYQIIGMGAAHGIIYDANHILIAKAIYQAEGLGMKLDPNFKVANGLEKFRRQYLQEILSPQKALHSIRAGLMEHKDTLLELPEHISKLITRLEQEPQHQIATHQLQEMKLELEYLTKRHNTGLILGALIIATGFLFYIERRPLFFGIPLSFVYMFLTLILVFYFFSIRRRRT
jgi:ubiquinone biosynthesis protein